MHCGLEWFQEHPCPPDIIGVNYQVTSERWLDHRADQFPPQYRGVAGALACADIEAVLALAAPTAGIGPLLDEAWERQQIPIAITEVHIDANREDQLCWHRESWEASKQARRKGVDVRAATVWSLLGAFDWNSLVTDDQGYYESGPFDLRGPSPRPTALAAMMRQLAGSGVVTLPVLHGKGWWRRPERLLCPPVAASEPGHQIAAARQRFGNVCAARSAWREEIEPLYAVETRQRRLCAPSENQVWIPAGSRWSPDAEAARCCVSRRARRRSC